MRGILFALACVVVMGGCTEGEPDKWECTEEYNAGFATPVCCYAECEDCSGQAGCGRGGPGCESVGICLEYCDALDDTAVDPDPESDMEDGG